MGYWEKRRKKELEEKQNAGTPYEELKKQKRIRDYEDEKKDNKENKKKKKE